MADRLEPVPGTTSFLEEPEQALLTELAGYAKSPARGRGAVLRLMLCGDWRTRVLATSAGGLMVRDDPTAWRRLSLTGSGVRSCLMPLRALSRAHDSSPGTSSTDRPCGQALYNVYRQGGSRP
jgi:hypothetical protein